MFYMVRPAGLEPATPATARRCSNPLSYGRTSRRTELAYHIWRIIKRVGGGFSYLYVVRSAQNLHSKMTPRWLMILCVNKPSLMIQNIINQTLPIFGSGMLSSPYVGAAQFIDFISRKAYYYSVRSPIVLGREHEQASEVSEEHGWLRLGAVCNDHHHAGCGAWVPLLQAISHAVTKLTIKTNGPTSRHHPPCPLEERRSLRRSSPNLLNYDYETVLRYPLL